MNEQGMTPSLFADRIDISRSSLSHIFSGRNKPSLEIVLKICRALPFVDLYWLLLGIKKDEKVKSKILNEGRYIEKKKELKKKSEQESIIVFFKDGTFKNYDPIEDKKI